MLTVFVTLKKTLLDRCGSTRFAWLIFLSALSIKTIKFAVINDMNFSVWPIPSIQGLCDMSSLLDRG